MTNPFKCPGDDTEGYRVFKELIAPIDPELFFETYYEKSDLVVKRAHGEHHDSILVLDDVDFAVTELNLNSSQISVVNSEADQPIKASDYIDPSGFADPRRVFELFEGGATIILPQLHRLLPKLGRFCAALETVFTQSFQTNVYMTPPTARGFKVHHDTHDVFIVQAAGSKDWTIYEPAVELPLRGQPNEPGEAFGDPQRGFRMESGDTAYIPRGLPHDARSTSEISLHITVGVLSNTWADLLVDAISNVCLHDSELRRSLPPGYASEAFDRGVAEEHFHKLLDKLVSQADFRSSFSAFADEFLSSRRQPFRRQLEAMATANSINLDTRLERREFLVYSLEIESDNETVLLKTYGLEMRLPVAAGPALRHALSEKSFTPRGLPEGLDDEGRLTLSRRLLREGLAVLASP